MQREAGFTYVVAMLLVAAVSVLALRGTELTVTREMRVKETQLLDVGTAYYMAIKSYYDNSPGSKKMFPPTLEALLLDARTTTVKRHLRRLYHDPITGAAKWGIVAAPDGAVMGVYSLSPRRPVKTAGFPFSVRVKENAMRYQEWQFVYQASEGH